MHTDISACAYIPFECIYVYMYVCVYTYICTYVYIHAYTLTYIKAGKINSELLTVVYPMSSFYF